MRVAWVLWTLLALFVLRVTGQALVAFLEVGFLPPMSEWYSGLLPYPVHWLYFGYAYLAAMLAR